MGAIRREFLIHVPAGLTRPRALMFVLHGGGGSGGQVANFDVHPLSVFRTVAEREGAIAVYPLGIDQQWNDCRSDASAIGEVIDDVAFLDALLAQLSSQFGIGAERSFIAGGSNGAMMAMRYAFERPERIAAIATSMGNLPAQPEPGRCTTGPAQPVPIAMFHGAADPAMPYAGGCVVQNVTGNCNRGTVISAEATRDRWLAINGLTTIVPQVTRVNVNSGDGGEAVRSSYPGSFPIDWWRLEGAGHSTPSLSVFLNVPDAGLQNRDVEFAEAAYAFFRARLPPG